MSVDVSSWIFRASREATPGRRLVLLALADFANPDGRNAYPALATLARMTRMTTRGVRYALRALEECGRIEVLGTHPTTRTVEYRVVMNERLELELNPPTEAEIQEAQEAAYLAAQGGHTLPPGGGKWVPVGANGSQVGGQMGASGAGAICPLTNTNDYPPTKTTTTRDQEDKNNGGGDTLFPPPPPVRPEPVEPELCYDLDYADEDWAPTYLGLDAKALKVEVSTGIVWQPPADVDVVFDLWRDLHWHMDAKPTDLRLKAIRTALKTYDVAMCCKALVGGLTDRWIQGDEDGPTYDKVETMLAITDKRDNVERLGNEVSDEALCEALDRAQCNRKYRTKFMAEDWTYMTWADQERWVRENRTRLRKMSPNRYNRLIAFKQAQNGVPA